jgi:gamma-glutamylputrescine oxidase
MDAIPDASDTYYAATALPRRKRPRLGIDVDTGVCIIGGGLAGLWTARALLARNHDVVVLEAGRVADGASGRNGGFVSAGYAQKLDAIVARVGLDHARALYQLSREGVASVASMLSEIDLDAVPGRLSVRRYDDEEGLRKEADFLAEKFDHDMVLWPTERVRATLKTEKYFQALHDAEAFHLHPLNLALALAEDLEKRGGRIYEMSAATWADLDGVRKWVGTSAGRVRAHHVVFCGSVFVGRIYPKLQRTVLPVATHVVVSAPLGKHLPEVIGYRGAISDTRRAFDYYRILGERLMWGGYITTRTSRPGGLERRFQRDIANIYPQLEGLKLDYAWTGVMGYAVHRMPQIGMLRPGVWIASAFGGQGLNTTAMAGDVIASAIAENDDRWRLFVPFGLVSAGGVVGKAMVQLVYLGAELRDRYDERTMELRKRFRAWRKEKRAQAAARRRERAKEAAARVALRKADKERRAAAREAEKERREAERKAKEEADGIVAELRAKYDAAEKAEKAEKAAGAAEARREAEEKAAREKAEAEEKAACEKAEAQEKAAREKAEAEAQATPEPAPALEPAPEPVVGFAEPKAFRKKKKRPKERKDSIEA